MKLPSNPLDDLLPGIPVCVAATHVGGLVLEFFVHCTTQAATTAPPASTVGLSPDAMASSRRSDKRYSAGALGWLN